MAQPISTIKSVGLAAAFLMTQNDLSALSVDKAVFESDFVRMKVPEGPWATHLMRINGINCLSLGKGVFVSASHTGAPGSAYDVKSITNSLGQPADLLIFRLLGARYENQSELQFADRLPSIGTRLLIATPEGSKAGWTVQAGKTDNPFGPLHEKLSDGFFMRSAIPGTTAEPGFASIHGGDSGSAIFMYDKFSNSWRVLGLLIASVNTNPGQIPGTFNDGFCADLSFASGYADQITAYRKAEPEDRPLIDKDQAMGVVLSGAALAGAAALISSAWNRRASKEKQ